MAKRAAKFGIGCCIAVLLFVIGTVILGPALRSKWNEGVVPLEATKGLVASSTDIRMEGDVLVATCHLTNTTGTVIRDAGYSARFTGVDKQYFGTTLGPVDTVPAGGSVSLEIKMQPAEEVHDVSGEQLKLELFLPERAEDRQIVPTKPSTATE